MAEKTAGSSRSRILAEFVTQLKYEDIPHEVVSRVVDHTLDTIGCLIAGSATDWMGRIAAVAKRLGGPPEASIVGDGTRVGVANAALANGALGRALDLDDTYFRPWDHVSAYVVPTAFTVGEWLGKSGREVITASVASYEVACRLGLARLRDRAFMYDPSVGAVQSTPALRTGALFGSAVGAGKLMGLNADQMTSAMGFAGSMGLFLMQTHREKAQAMPFNNGWACHAGLIAAFTADTGLKGPQLIFEGDRGYFAALNTPGEFDVRRLTENLGEVWEGAYGTIKFYPAGHGTHYYLNSLKVLRRDGLRADDVLEINCYVPQMRAEFHFLPKEKAYHPGPYDARFSLPYLLAVMLLDGEVGIRSFSEDKVRDPKISETAQKITHTVDEESWRPDSRGRIVVKTRDGRVLEQKTHHSQLPGTPENPAPREDIVYKFRDNASLALPEASINRLLDALQRLEEVDNVADIMRMTAP